jgi:hypothetical protein
MADAADCSMPDAFAKDYLDKIMKKTEKKGIMRHKIINNPNQLYG